MGVRGFLKCFVTGGSEVFLLAFCVCGGGGGQVQYLSLREKNKRPLLLINDGPYNKKPQWSLRRLSFFKDTTCISFTLTLKTSYKVRVM